MEPTHVHLLTNHIPILGSIFGCLVLAIGMILKNKSVEVTGVATILLAAMFTVPAFLSGEEAEHIVEHLQGISEFQLEEHEEHAELSLWLMIAAGILSLMSIVSYRWAPHLTKVARSSTLIVSALAFVSMIPLANHGGKIVHSELRAGDEPSQSEHEHHDESEEDSHE